MSSPLETLDPQPVWRHFDAIRQIPRPSKHEEQIVEHVLAWTRQRRFEVRSDAAGNLVVRVPATPGHEEAPTVVIQAHLDMVCEKNSDVEHDFMTDPIQVKVDGDWVKAVGTTLGSDNGLGVASAMAVADDPEVVHGPLELLFTLDEETGLTGAALLDSSLVTGRLMLNLDSEEDGIVYIGCAGGGTISTTFPCVRTPAAPDTVPLKLSVTGLRGGHSGGDIHENRANAIKLAARFLRRARQERLHGELVSLDGGSKNNAIPREAFAVLRGNAKEVPRLKELIHRLSEELQAEFGEVDSDIRLELATVDASDELLAPMRDDMSQRLVDTLNGLPHGVLSMSRRIDGLVESSNNVAVVETSEEAVVVTTSHRSSVMAALDAVEDMVRSIAELGGGVSEVHGVYAGWNPNPKSPIVRKTAQVYEDLFGAPPELKAIHAGLECGVLLERVPGLDVVSFGPEIRGAHSPDEKANIPSTRKFYRLLKGLLANLAEASPS